jgi:hypothetical protein
MDSRFVNAFTVPTRIKFLGRSVYPFCLRHRLLLMALGSPLVEPGEPVKPVDLIIAAQVCSAGTIGDFGFWDRVWIWRLGRDQELMTKAVKVFAEHVGLDDWPKFWSKAEVTKGKAEDSGIPWILAVIANLVQGGLTPEEAWEMPEAQAIWLNSAFAMNKGADLNLMTTEEEKMMEDLTKQGAAPAKETDHGH